MVPVQFAGEPVVPSEKRKPAFMLVALVDDAQHAVCARRSAICPRKPAAVILDPQLGIRTGGGPNAILNLVGHTVPVVALVRLHHSVETGLRILGFEQLRVTAAGRNGRHIID